MNKNDIKIRLVKSEQEQQALYFQRWLVLRKPLGLAQGTEQDKYENQAIPLIAVMEDKVVGSVRFRILANNLGSLSYLSVLPEFQGQGIGKQLVLHLIEIARKKGVKTVRARARKGVLGFYEKLGFVARGEETIFLDIPHVFVYLDL